MRRSSLVLVLSVCGALTGSAPALADEGSAGEAIPGQYIVVVKQDRDPAAVARWQDARNRHVFDSVNGFSAALDAAQVRALEASARVAYVEPDRVVTASVTQTMNAAGDPWGLDRIDQRALPLSGTYTYTGRGAGVTAYVIDTGIRTTTAVRRPGRQRVRRRRRRQRAHDCNGHGTHVAGTVGGSTYGVAKARQLVAVRVLNCSGSGTTSGVIAGIDWVTREQAAPAVANMSPRRRRSHRARHGRANSIAGGVTYAVAAGNESAQRLQRLAGPRATAITVGATTSTDARASFSNFGTCLDLFAPGSSITSAWYTSDTATNTISGTSMATPARRGRGRATCGQPRPPRPRVRDELVGHATNGSDQPGRFAEPAALQERHALGTSRPEPSRRLQGVLHLGDVEVQALRQLGGERVEAILRLRLVLRAQPLERGLDLRLRGAELGGKILRERVAALTGPRQAAADVRERGAQLGLADAETVGEAPRIANGPPGRPGPWCANLASWCTGRDCRAVVGLGAERVGAGGERHGAGQGERGLLLLTGHALSLPTEPKRSRRDPKLRDHPAGAAGTVATVPRWLSLTPPSISSRCSCSPGRPAAGPHSRGRCRLRPALRRQLLAVAGRARDRADRHRDRAAGGHRRAGHAALRPRRPLRDLSSSTARV